MKTKTYKAQTKDEALDLAIAELGDPIIVEVRTVNGMIRGRKESHIEVVAQVDGEYNNSPSISTGPVRATKSPRGYSNWGKQKVEINDELPEHILQEGNTGAHEEEEFTHVVTKEVEPAPSELEDTDSLEQHLYEIKRLLKGANLADTTGSLIQRTGTRHSIHKNGAWFYDFADMLASHGLDDDAIDLIARVALTKLSAEQVSSPIVRQDFTEQLVQYILRDCGLSTQDIPSYSRIAFMGPTGVGKTTTIAKIAADLVFNQKRTVAIVTIDNYRIAAAEQIAVYADVLEVPMILAETPDQLKSALKKFEDIDVVLIDTAGRSPSDPVAIEEMGKFFSVCPNIEKHLVLSATTREQELYKACQKFTALEINNAVFTKLDECADLGVLLNFYLKQKIPFSFLTNGQKVPEDILTASANQTTKLIFGK